MHIKIMPHASLLHAQPSYPYHLLLYLNHDMLRLPLNLDRML